MYPLGLVVHLGGAAALVAPRRRPSHRAALVVEVLQPGRETLGVRNSGKRRRETERHSHSSAVVDCLVVKSIV